MEEVWKDIQDYDGLYQVSNLGRVKSIDRKVLQFNGYSYSYRIYRGKILKQSVTNNGYKKVTLYNKKPKTISVHRLVAQAFIPNPNNYSQVNHIDENKENNCVNNLEWCDSKYNINYQNRNAKVAKALKGRAKSNEHKKKLSDIAKRRIIIRNKKGQIKTCLSGAKSSK